MDPSNVNQHESESLWSKKKNFTQIVEQKQKGQEPGLRDRYFECTIMVYGNVNDAQNEGSKIQNKHIPIHGSTVHEEIGSDSRTVRTMDKT